MDFDAIVREALKSGISTDEVAKQVTNALNKYNEEQTTKAKEKKEKAAYVNQISKEFWHKTAEEQADKEDVVRLAVLVYNESHPEWTLDQLTTFHDSILFSLDATADLVGKTEEELKEDVVNLLATFGDDCEEIITKGIKKAKTRLSEADSIIKEFLKGI